MLQAFGTKKLFGKKFLMLVPIGVHGMVLNVHLPCLQNIILHVLKTVAGDHCSFLGNGMEASKKVIRDVKVLVVQVKSIMQHNMKVISLVSQRVQHSAETQILKRM